MERNIANELKQIIEYLTEEKKHRLNYLDSIADGDEQNIRMIEGIENIDHAVLLLRAAACSLEVSGI